MRNKYNFSFFRKVHFHLKSLLQLRIKVAQTCKLYQCIPYVSENQKNFYLKIANQREIEDFSESLKSTIQKLFWFSGTQGMQLATLCDFYSQLQETSCQHLIWKCTFRSFLQNSQTCKNWLNSNSKKWRVNFNYYCKSLSKERCFKFTSLLASEKLCFLIESFILPRKKFYNGRSFWVEVRRGNQNFCLSAPTASSLGSIIKLFDRYYWG